MDESPYTKLHQVVQKIADDHAHCILVVPNWERRKWYKAARHITVATLEYPANIKFFQHPFKRNRPSLWPVTAFILCGHPERCSLEHLQAMHAKPKGQVHFGPSCHLASLPRARRRWDPEAKPPKVTKVPIPTAISVTRSEVSPPVSPGHGRNKKLLDLFCGTGSISKIYKEEGYETVTVDLDGKWDPDIQVDVLNWDYKSRFAPGEFDTITCGIPCTEFSIALTVRPRNLPLGDLLAEKALEIIAYLKPRRWWLENPRTGLLKSRPYMADIPFVDVDYCQYCDWGYQKPTRIWGDKDTISNFTPKVCDGKTCPNLDLENPPTTSKGRLRHKVILGTPGKNMSQSKKFRIPPELVKALLQAGRGEPSQPPMGCGSPPPGPMPARQVVVPSCLQQPFPTAWLNHVKKEKDITKSF